MLSGKFGLNLHGSKRVMQALYDLKWSKVLKLLELNSVNISEVLRQHDNENGNLINDGLSKLFDSMSDEDEYYEVAIKVAALNSMYSTAIQYIYPIVDKITSEIKNNDTFNEERDYVGLVDKIATVTWISKRNDKEITRCNLSFSSKYIHFLSGRKTPIYDSYIWIVMVGYLIQSEGYSYRFNAPNSYSDFYSTFIYFKNKFDLHHYSNYEIDKYLWQYGKTLITEIIQSESVSMDKAKGLLKNRITKPSTRCL